MPLVATEALASDTPGLPQSNGVADGGNGLPEEGSKGPSQGSKRPTLDLFWKLGQAKSEKQRVDVACQVLSSLASKALPPDYALGRLVRGLAASSADTRQGFFICLTEFLRQSETKYADVAKVLGSSLRLAAGTASKSEEADFLLGRLLTITAVLRAEIVPDAEREAVLSELLTIANARNYLLLPVFRLLVEHFVPLGGSLVLIILKSINIDKMDIDSLYLLLSLLEKDENVVSSKVIEILGVKEVWGKRALTIYSRVLASANAPPSVVARHPLLPLMVATLVRQGALQKYWQALSSDMTVANNSGLTGWIFLREVGKKDASQLPALLSRHALSVGLQLAGRQASASLPKEVLAILVKGVEAGEVDRAEIVKMLLAQDINWDKTALGGQVGELMGKANVETVKEVGELFLKCLKSEGKLPERTHSASQLVKLVGHPAVQGDLAWRGRALEGIASVSLLQGVQDVAKLNRQGWEGLRDCLTRALDSRNRTLEDSINLTLALVTWIREQLEQASVSLLKTVTPEQETMGRSTMEVVIELEKQWKGKEKDKEAGVLLLLHSHMWLQIFLQPDLAVEVLEELKPVYSRWKSREKSSEEEPGWVEVVTEILLSILASNNRLLRGVVGSVFSVICPQMNEAAMLSLLNVIRKKSQADADEDEEEEEDDEDGSEDEEEENETDKENGGSDVEYSSSDDDDDDLEDGLGDAVEVSADLKKKLGDALGKHKEESEGEEEEDELDMDDIPEEDMKELDKKLAEAFKAIGGRKDRLTKKKEAMAALAEMHFKLRVLDLVELYLTNKPQPGLLCQVVPALFDALDRAVRAEANSVLVSRLVAVMGKVVNLPGKLSKEEVKEAGDQLVGVLQELFSRAGSGSVVVATLGKTYSRLTTALLRLGELGGLSERMEKVYLQALEDFLHNKTCVLPPETFGLAMAHNWPGCWAIASQLAKEALKPSLRQFRRVSVLSLLSSVLGNKRLIIEAPTKATALETDLLPSLASELDRLVEGDLVRKLKPKYIQEILSVLIHLKTHLPDNEKCFGPSFEKLLGSMAGAWPEGKHWQEAKKLLTRLATKFSLTLVFTLRKKESDETAMENPEELSFKKKGKKKKRKNQEQLKKAKEMKMELAAAQVDVGVPSFSDFVTDNTEVVEEEAKRKRKGLEDGNSSRDKKHKKKKLKKESKVEG